MRRTADIVITLLLDVWLLVDREAGVLATQEQLNAIVAAAREGRNADSTFVSFPLFLDMRLYVGIPPGYATFF